MHRITTQVGVTISAETSGDGPPLVLIPGAGGTRSTWDPLWESLTGAHRCTRYDLRGCGASTDSTTGRFRHADDLVAVLDRLGIDRASMAGVSMGGRTALDLALTRPDRVDRLVLISPGLAGWEWSPAWRRHWRELTRAARAGRLDETRERWFHHPLFTTTRRDPVLAARLRADIAADTCRVWLDDDREDPPPRPHVETLDRLTVPVLLITGANDLADFRMIAQIITAMVTDVRWVDLPDTGHLVPLERPDAAAHAITTFLADT